MNKLLIGLGVILVIVAGLFFVIDKAEDKSDLYTDVPKVNEVNQGTSGDYFVYFSRETCSHCEDIRSDVEKFYDSLVENNPEVGFYLIDMEEEANQKYFTSEEESVVGTDYYIDPATIPSGYDINEFKIAGTPTLLYVSDGVITDIAVGASGEATSENPMGVTNLLEKKATDLGFEYNAVFND